MDETGPQERSTTVVLPPPGGRLGRGLLAGACLLLGLLQVAVGIQAERTATAVGGAVIVLVGVSLGRRVGDGVLVGHGGLSLPGWPRGGIVPWEQVDRLVVLRRFGLTRLGFDRGGRRRGRGGRQLALLTPAQARELVPRVASLAAEHDVEVIDGARAERRGPAAG